MHSIALYRFWSRRGEKTEIAIWTLGYIGYFVGIVYLAIKIFEAISVVGIGTGGLDSLDF